MGKSGIQKKVSGLEPSEGKRNCLERDIWNLYTVGIADK